jgi:hypothetical protein
MIKSDGKFRAKARDVMVGESGVKHTPYVGVLFEVLDEGENKGERIEWKGWLGDKSAERTIESLRHCGWQGDDIGSFATGKMDGLDTNEVELVVEMKPYEGTNESHKGKLFPEVRWVNKLGGSRGLRKEEGLDAVKAAQLGERFRGLALAVKPAASPPTNDQLQGTSFPFGAASGSRKAF